MTRTNFAPSLNVHEHSVPSAEMEHRPRAVKQDSGSTSPSEVLYPRVISDHSSDLSISPIR